MAISEQIDHWRQLNIVSPSQLEQYPVTVIGAGGIGSPVVQVITKMGVSDVTVYDHDKVEMHNLPNQLYRLSDIGEHKVVALQHICREMSGVEITACPELFTSQKLSGIVVCAVDSMQARIDIWQEVSYNPNIRLFVDARMGGLISRIHTVRPWDLDEVTHYENTLHTDEEAVEDPCTARAIIFNVYNIAAQIADIIKRVAKEDPIPLDLYFDWVNLSFFHTKMEVR